MGQHQPVPADLGTAARAPVQHADRIVLRDGSDVHIIPISKLDYAEAQDDYVALASEGKKRLKQQTISSLEQSLDPARFLRIHRSYILNLDRLKKLNLTEKTPTSLSSPTARVCP